MQFKLHLDRRALANFHEVERRDGLTQRSCVEVAFELASLFCGDAESRRARLPQWSDEELAALERAVTAAWQACYRIGARDAMKSRKAARKTITVEIETARMESLKACSMAKEVALHAIVATVFTPWGSGWCPKGDLAYEIRQKLWDWAKQPARDRDHDRRSRSTQEGPQAPAGDVTGEPPGAAPGIAGPPLLTGPAPAG